MSVASRCAGCCSHSWHVAAWQDTVDTVRHIPQKQRPHPALQFQLLWFRQSTPLYLSMSESMV